jgi:glyoxylase-like metal-dependent hydrolase (beta-lactamase superfamily II)
LHKDHASGICYGNAPAFNLMFPSAKYYCQQKEMEDAFLRNDAPSYVLEKLDFLKHTPNLVYLDGDGKIGDAITYEVSGGHTRYHQVFTIDAGGLTCFFGGDVLPQPNQLLMKFSAKYDYDGKVSAEKRMEYGQRAAEKNLVCLFFHSVNMTMARVKMDVNNKFLLEKV